MFPQSPILYLAEKIDDTLCNFCEQSKKTKSIYHNGGGRNRKSSFDPRDKYKVSTSMRIQNSHANLDHYNDYQISNQPKITNENTDGQEDDAKGYSSREETPNSCLISEGNHSELEDLHKQLDKMAFTNGKGGIGRTRKRPNRNNRIRHSHRFNKYYFASLARFPERYITERCECDAGGACTYVKLRGTAMKECHCRSHHRFLPNNIRVKMENAIIEHIIKHLLGNPVRILSLGPGAYLEDLMIILRLAEAGMKSIHIAMVEPNPCSKAYPDFKLFSEKIKDIYGMSEISCSNYTDINQVDSEEEFDVIYAIDYEACNSKEYLQEHRHIEVHNDEIQDSDPEKPTWDLIKAAKFLTSEEHGLVIVSKCRHILHKTPQSLPFYGMP